MTELEKLFRRVERLPENPRTAKSRITNYNVFRRIAELHNDQPWVEHWDGAIRFEQCAAQKEM